MCLSVIRHLHLGKKLCVIVNFRSGSTQTKYLRMQESQNLIFSTQRWELEPSRSSLGCWGWVGLIAPHIAHALYMGFPPFLYNYKKHIIVLFCLFVLARIKCYVRVIFNVKRMFLISFYKFSSSISTPSKKDCSLFRESISQLFTHRTYTHCYWNECKLKLKVFLKKDQSCIH